MPLNNTVDKKQLLLKKMQEFCLMDDNFMTRVFDENIECTELILRIILNNADIKVSEVRTQKEIKNLLGRSVRLDISAKDVDGKPMDVEIQRADKGAGVRRARYNSSLMDANTLVAGEDCDDLPDSYVIFITENDVMGAGIPIYHADRVIAETGKYLNDGSHILYVNGEYRGDDPVGWLMHDFSCKKAEDMHYKSLAEQVRYYKEDPKGVEVMCKLMEDLVEEFIDEEKKESALRFLKMGTLSYEEIAKGLGLSLETIIMLVEQEGK